ncbi:MAG: Gfo/Idh/MocA family oxidoreductase [Planctomycetia bacterium]|nr:Gfo/Idh/MocA family oxidoreductase [Planctomycetia bacterium]
MKRREFLSAGALAAGVTLLSRSSSVYGTPANDEVHLAMIGCGGRSWGLGGGFHSRNDARFIYCADAIQGRAEDRANKFTKNGERPKVVQDMRAALDDKSVDAVVIATCDHWHALAAIWAAQAGKDVYVEKPCSLTAWEGEQMVKAAKKYNVIIQHGTQNRSAAYNISAKKFIDEGNLGRLQYCRVYNMKGNNAPFRIGKGEAIPSDLDWDLWCGPAPKHEYSETYVHHWHYLWDFGCGDFSNDGIHQLDLARWLIGKEFPNSVYSIGGNYATEGDRDTPDTQTVLFDYGDLTLNFEMTQNTPYILKTDGHVRNSDMFPYWMQNGTRIELYGDRAMMIIGRHGGGWQAFARPQSRKPVVIGEQFGRFPDAEHQENFISCIRSRQKPNADIETGHRSALMIHYGCISFHLRDKININPQSGSILDCPAAAPLWKREYRLPYEIPEIS